MFDGLSPVPALILPPEGRRPFLELQLALYSLRVLLWQQSDSPTGWGQLHGVHRAWGTQTATAKWGAMHWETG